MSGADFAEKASVDDRGPTAARGRRGKAKGKAKVALGANQACAAQTVKPLSAKRQAQKQAVADTLEPPAADLLACPVVPPAVPALRLDAMHELDDEIARKVQRRLQRHREKQQRLRL